MALSLELSSAPLRSTWLRLAYPHFGRAGVELSHEQPAAEPASAIPKLVIGGQNRFIKDHVGRNAD
jgi:hypothetical protein